MRPVSRIRRAAAVFASASSLLLGTAFAHDMNVNNASTQAKQNAPSSVGDVLFEKVKSLIGTWDAPERDGVLTDIFKPFANGTAVLGAELLNGKQITTTIFYVVNGQLRADHYCDFENQPRYTAVPAMDQNTLDFEFRDATNLDTHPVHFHYTRWQIVDNNHLTQDWYAMGGKKPVSDAHLVFTRRSTADAVPGNP